MDRRKFLIGAGSLAAGGAAATGSGAFTSANNARSVSVAVADDSDALLALKSGSQPNSAYTGTDNGELEVYFNDEASTSGTGVPSNSYMTFDQVFKVQNQGSQKVEVGLDQFDDGSLELGLQDPGGATNELYPELINNTGYGDEVHVAYNAETKPSFDPGDPPAGDNDPDGDGSIELDPGEEVFVDFAILTDGDSSFPDVNTLLITAEAE